MALLDTTTGAVWHPDYFSLEQELTTMNAPMFMGTAMNINDIKVTLKSDFNDFSVRPLVPIQIDDPDLVETIIKNQSDSSVANACASYLENMSGYICAEAALKEQKLDAVNIEVTSWVEKKKLQSTSDISSPLDIDSDISLSKSSEAVEQSCMQNTIVRQLSPAISNNVGNLLHGTAGVPNKRVYRCSRCTYTHSELKEVAAHQATFHLPEKKTNATPSTASLPLNISKVECSHCKQKHIVGRYSCRNCTFETMCPMELEEHMWNVHKSMHIYHCPCCSNISQSYMEIENHLIADHASGRKDISKTTASSKDTELPKPVDEEKRIDKKAIPRGEDARYKCMPCSFYSKSKDEYKTHVSKYHNPYSCMPYMCLLCGKEAFNKHGLELHSKNRHKSEPQSFALNSSSLSLMQEVTDRKCRGILNKGQQFDRSSSSQWWCLVCGSGPQPYVYHLTPHIASHLCYTPYQCTACEMQFKLQLLANNHIKESKICAGKGSVRINNYLKKLQMADIEILRTDVLLFNGYAQRKLTAKDAELPFLCQICHYACRSPSYLLQHMSVHLPHKPHKCPAVGCDHSYVYKSGCVAHLKAAHTGLKTPVIKDLNLLAQQKKESQELVLENSIHLPKTFMEAKSYRELNLCSICNFGPLGKAGLSIHLAFHSEQTPYECGRCGQKFKQRLVANAHVMEVHSSNDLKTDNAEAAAQALWIAVALKNCNTTSPDYSLKPVSKFDTKVPARLLASYSCENPGKSIEEGTGLSVVKPTASTSRLQKLYRCTLCQFYTISYGNSKNHVVTHLSFKPYECSICQKKYQSSMFCGKHLHSLHQLPVKKNMKVLSDVYKEQTSASAQLIEVVPIMQGMNVAELLKNQKPKLKKPEPVVSPDTKDCLTHYICVYCKFETVSRVKARHHFMLSHAKTTPYSCTYCSFERSLRQVVQRHVSLEHPELQGRSDVVFVNEAKEKALKKSLDYFLKKSHKQNSRKVLLEGSTTTIPEHYKAICITSSGRSCVYKCSKCSYTARSIDAFKKHVQEHLSIEQYRCAHCNYSNDKHIYRHIRTIHGSKEEYDEVVETKAFIMLVTQMEDLAREVLLLDEMYHTEDANVTASDAFPSTPDYKCTCLHCKESFSSLVIARKHHREAHPAKQLMVDVDLCFVGAATDSDKPEDDLEDLDIDLDEEVLVAPEPLSTKVVKCEPKGQKVSTFEMASSCANAAPGSSDMASLSIDEANSKEPVGQKKANAETNPSDKIKCHLCKTYLSCMTTLKRHLVSSHTSLRPYGCSNCRFVSHDAYEIKRHGVKIHVGKIHIIKDKNGIRKVRAAMKNFMNDWKAVNSGLLKTPWQRKRDDKLDMKPVVRLEDISKNLDFAKYFKKY